MFAITIFDTLITLLTAFYSPDFGVKNIIFYLNRQYHFYVILCHLNKCDIFLSPSCSHKLSISVGLLHFP